MAGSSLSGMALPGSLPVGVASFSAQVPVIVSLWQSFQIGLLQAADFDWVQERRVTKPSVLQGGIFRHLFPVRFLSDLRPPQRSNPHLQTCALSSLAALEVPPWKQGSCTWRGAQPKCALCCGFADWTPSLWLWGQVPMHASTHTYGAD